MKKILFLAILIGCSYLGKAQDIEEIDSLDISVEEEENTKNTLEINLIFSNIGTINTGY